jgi:predicted acyltransferase
MKIRTKNLRCRSLDIFRALVIPLFIFFNLVGTFVPQGEIPFFLRHNQGILLFGDLIAPSFAFILGAALYFSYQNSLRKKSSFMTRKIRGFLQLILLGMVLDGLVPLLTESCDGPLRLCLNWGVLQSLGLGGLFALLFIKLRNESRTILCLSLLLLYSKISIYAFPLPSSPDAFRHGGIIGGAGYGFISVFGIISAELLTQNRKRLFLFGVVLFILALAGSIISPSTTPFNKMEVTSSFILISSAFSIFFWLLLSNFEFLFPKFLDVLSQNSLLLWILIYVLIWYPIFLYSRFLNIGITGGFDFTRGAVISVFFTILLVSISLIIGRNRKSISS